ncbi:MlaE family lipid ABC transporter permease subunit [Sulfurimonas aquatica]|uniref:MlaE family lipid ABC transporter permease subunit n=1 Tax=Sulfurimonas aquatica TaxID=2672570 RepID=A0A975GCD7_9BACT|nr:MlaE family lipid ABC transporter permease subunit [Sulfurimonas aquatica]QSZ41169.1 MlaE family lipid ABC transporter permease subunit [Sulfurimonas aquatica]
MAKELILQHSDEKLSILFSGELTLYTIANYQKQLENSSLEIRDNIVLDLKEVSFIDTAGALFLNKLEKKYKLLEKNVKIESANKEVFSTLELIKKQEYSHQEKKKKEELFRDSGSSQSGTTYLAGIFSFFAFLGKLFMTKVYYIKCAKFLRFKEMAFELNESAIKALGIVSLTSFLIGLVVAYQSAYQLKIYGANIYIVDMLGISILRELAPLITAIVIAGRSGSAFTAQIGAMKITQELDAMQTMGFDPFRFLVIPRIFALMIAMPLLIFVADIMGILGGMLIANIDLGISVDLFLNRFNEVVAAKHFFVGIVKGPFFAFLIATISIYRGMIVKDDTQSIGFNTTKSVVESIFAVIVCDALFSIAFTNLGI